MRPCSPPTRFREFVRGGGRVLGEVGVRVRRELEGRLGRKIFLEMRVNVERDWQGRPAVMRRLVCDRGGRGWV